MAETVKSKLLSELEKNKGTFISGAKLAETLSCSRGAVWKAADILKKEGYPLLSVPNRGYCLPSQSDLLSKEAVRTHLKRPDVRIEIYRDIPSTNQRLKQIAVTDMIPEGSLVLASGQSAGRGHSSHVFYSPASCGLYVSTLLRQQAQMVDDQTLTSLAAVAVCRVIKKLYQIDLSIKWKNDLVLYLPKAQEWRKIGGILTEVSRDIDEGSIDYAIVGIGLNLTSPPGGYPENLSHIAASLQDTTDQKLVFDRCLIAALIVSQLLTISKDPSAMQEYIQRNMLPGRIVTIDGQEDRPAEVLSITGQGGLQIRYLAEKETVILKQAQVRLTDPSKEAAHV